jgi:hypothetical protein
MEAGRPTGRDRRFDGQRINGDGGVITGVPDRQEGEQELKIASPGKGGKMSGDRLPHSRGPLQSAVGQELAAEKYTKRKGIDESETTAV